MCIAIHKPKNVLLSDDHMEESFLCNPDGAGFAAAVGGKIILRKGFFTYEEFRKAFKPYARNAALVHFRIATSGGINAEMCHPFSLCGGKYALIHNGILGIEHDKSKESDTSKFCRSVLTPLLDAGVPLSSPSLHYLVEEAIGPYNKIAVMSGDGQTVIFNESEGNETKGIWYSNHSYLPRVKVSTSWADTPKFLSRLTGEKLAQPEYCWYCGNSFHAENYDDVLCTSCNEMEDLPHRKEYRK